MWMLASVTALLTQTAAGLSIRPPLGECGSSSNVIQCNDGTSCEAGESNRNCCGFEGRTTCPSDIPIMCAEQRFTSPTCAGANCCTNQEIGCPNKVYRTCYPLYFVKTEGVLKCYDADTPAGKEAAAAAYKAEANDVYDTMKFGLEPIVPWAESLVGVYKVIIHDDCGSAQLSADALLTNPKAPKPESEIIEARDYINMICRATPEPPLKIATFPSPKYTQYQKIDIERACNAYNDNPKIADPKVEDSDLKIASVSGF